MSVCSGSIVILSYPDTVVRPAYAEFSSKIWPLLGIGGKDAVKAGHAALLLVDHESQEIEYFDFGRYITTEGSGRVRSKHTDHELDIPIQAVCKNGEIQNIKEILLWLEAHPQKTHGEGRLVAGVCEQIDYNKAKEFIHNMLMQKEIAYGAFVKGGSNCARFVTDVLIHSVKNPVIKNKLQLSYIITPSPIGNVMKATTSKCIYTVFQGQISVYKNRSILKEYFQCFLKKIDKKVNKIGTELPNLKAFDLSKGTWLGGIGSGAWFKVIGKNTENEYVVSRFDALGNQDMQAVFELKKKGFNWLEKHTFLHPSNCEEVFVLQRDVVYVLEVKKV